jgi:putative intracellular protease/amidase
MPAKVTRFGSFARGECLPTIDQFAEKFDVSRASITETLVMGLALSGITDEQIKAAVEAGKQWIKEHHVDGRRQRGDAIKRLRALPKAELEKLLAQANPE